METYKAKLGLIETEIAIKYIKDSFEAALAKKLNLSRVSAPLFVPTDSGLNDDLSGVERSVSFDILETGTVAEVVHSLAKWKRDALARYGFAPHTGIYTDMNAIRRDEVCDDIHSIYVDQWDWEKVILNEDRNCSYLKETVRDIYSVIHEIAACVMARWPHINISLPADITFITAQQLEDEYPGFSPKQREDAAAKKHGAIFIIGIGGALKSGCPHDGRAPDYDDWAMNGDIIVYYPLIGRALELSSMGIRVNAQSLKNQLETSGKLARMGLPYHTALANGALPLTIGGGIGQSRLCMLMLERAHIGEVQASVWPPYMIKECASHNIFLL